MTETTRIIILITTFLFQWVFVCLMLGIAIAHSDKPERAFKAFKIISGIWIIELIKKITRKQ